MRTHTPVFAVILLISGLGGCASTPTAGRAATPAAPAAERGESTPIPLLINGDPVPWSTIRPLLAEASGREVVRELALEASLRRELDARGIEITDRAVQHERERWSELLGPELAAETAPAIRRRRGLGPARFGRMLWRNAALRALLDPDEIAVSDEEVRLADTIRHGRRFAVSIVTVPGVEAAVDVSMEARASTSEPSAGLWIGALRHGARPRPALVSPVDPAVPDAIRRAIASTPPGSVSGAVSFDGGYAVVLVHAALPAEEGRETDESIREELVIRKTRLAMERLAERLASRSTVHVLDRSLSWGRVR